MTNQVAYDKVKAHLLKQGKRSGTEDGDACYYRGPDGTMCAVGCLIPDDQYKPEFEGSSVYGLPYELRSFFGADTHLLAALQTVHDTEEVSDWEDKLAEVAKDFNLNP